MAADSESSRREFLGALSAGPPIRLSDSELAAVMAAARPLPVERRDTFLQAVAAELRGREVGPGVVYRVTAQVQRQFFEPPDLSRASEWSKHA